MMKNNTIILTFGGFLLAAVLILFVPFLFKDDPFGIMGLCALPLAAIGVPPLLGMALRRLFHKNQ